MIDLAVAVIIGVAFGAVVNSLVDDVIMAFIGAVFGEPNFDNLTLDLLTEIRDELRARR